MWRKHPGSQCRDEGSGCCGEGEGVGGRQGRKTMPMMQAFGGKGMQRLGSWLLQMWTEARVLLEGRAVPIRTGLQLRGGEAWLAVLVLSVRRMRWETESDGTGMQ